VSEIRSKAMSTDIVFSPRCPTRRPVTPSPPVLWQFCPEDRRAPRPRGVRRPATLSPPFLL